MGGAGILFSGGYDISSGNGHTKKLTSGVLLDSKNQM
jgi:hypothetical protein